MNELTCIFCGATAIYHRNEISSEHNIECDNCGIIAAFDVDLTEEEAIEHYRMIREKKTMNESLELQFGKIDRLARMIAEYIKTGNSDK
jgi:transcription elongation factor Elf1